MLLYTRRTFDMEHPVEEADAVITGIPFDSTGLGESTKNGPLFIREALKNLHGYDPETKKNPFAELKLCDAGDIEVVPGNWKLTNERIRETVDEILDANGKAFPIFLGGEHLVTLGIVESLKKKVGKFTIIDLDAHRDLKDDWLGEKHSHITWVKRALDAGFDIVQLGCRSWDETEEKAIKKVKSSLKGIKGPVYLTIDIDVLDPSTAPEVGTPEPDGMNQQEFFGILKEVSKMNLIGMDVVECASRRVGTQTALMCAQCIKKVLAGRF